jgi:Ca2+-binding RTX toxin-like protein
MMLRDYGARALKISILLASVMLMCAAVAAAAPRSMHDDLATTNCDPAVDDSCVPLGDVGGDQSCDPTVDETCAEDPVADEEGTVGDDTLTGDEQGEQIDTGDGADTVDAGAGDDQVDLGDGSDLANGGEGNDVLSGGLGNDVLNGGDGNDNLIGGPGADVENGGAGNDVVEGSAGADTLIGGPGVDTILGGPGKDTINARDGKRDLVRCGPGRDRATVDRFDRVRGCEVVKRH